MTFNMEIYGCAEIGEVVYHKNTNGTYFLYEVVEILRAGEPFIVEVRNYEPEFKTKMLGINSKSFQK